MSSADKTMDLRPYRVDWRYAYPTIYTLVDYFDDHEKARDVAKDHVRKFRGECRVITNHVIERVR
jgi:hypothetical protein